MMSPGFAVFFLMAGAEVVLLFLLAKRANEHRLSLSALWPAIITVNLGGGVLSFLGGVIAAYKGVGAISVANKMQYLTRGFSESSASLVLGVLSIGVVAAVWHRALRRSSPISWRERKGTLSAAIVIGGSSIAASILLAALAKLALAYHAWTDLLSYTNAIPTELFERRTEIIVRYVSSLYLAWGAAWVAVVACAALLAYCFVAVFRMQRPST